jgi:hypothetical protein
VGVERVIAVNLTKASLGLSVARVVIPKLEMAAVSASTYVLGPRGRSVIARRQAFEGLGWS